MASYLESIRQLPLPTVEQTDNFARHVVKARSWYKHLPMYPPGKRFVFFLDSNAGRTAVQHGEVGPATIEDITENDCWHYSMLPTPRYRERFGYWDYAVLNQKPIEGPELPDDPRYLSQDVINTCSCSVTAFVHRMGHLFGHCLDAAIEEKEPSFEWALSYANVHPHDPDVGRYAPLFALVSEGRKIDWKRRKISPEDAIKLAPEIQQFASLFGQTLRTFADRERALLNERVRVALQQSRMIFADLCGQGG